MERSCGDGRGKDGDVIRDRGESRDDAPTLANNNSCNVSNISQTLDDKFLKKLDALGLDLSMDIADLSALIDDSDYVKDAAGYQQSETRFDVYEGTGRVWDLNIHNYRKERLGLESLFHISLDVCINFIRGD